MFLHPLEVFGFYDEANVKLRLFTVAKATRDLCQLTRSN